MNKYRRYLIKKNLEPFIITVTGSDFTIPTTGVGYNYNIYVVETEQSFSGVTGNQLITFPSPGTYTIKISGDFPQIYFNNGTEKLKLTSIEQWGDIEWSSLDRAFKGCANMIYNASDIPKLSFVENMRSTFEDCFIFNGDLSNWDVSNVNNMQYTFNSCEAFDSELLNWDVSNVTIMRGLFYDCSVFNSDLSNWDVSNVTDMQEIFRDASLFNQDLSNWDVSNVENMYRIFSESEAFNQDISGWDVSNVTDMKGMFLNTTAFNQDLSGWCVLSIPSEPSNFATGATSWVLPKPVWGTCP